MYDVVIIGAGPAGLATGYALKRYTNTTFTIIDSGKQLFDRSRYGPQDLIQGIGGAGLFSDGKFSFYPSSTALWELDDKELLSLAYNWYCDNLKSHLSEANLPGTDLLVSATEHHKDKSAYSIESGLNIGDHHDQINYELPEIKKDTLPSNTWFLKSYPSICLTLAERYQLIDNICHQIGFNNFMMGQTVSRCEKIVNPQNEYYCVSVLNSDTGHRQEIICRYIVVAGGRFWPHLFNTTNTTNTTNTINTINTGTSMQLIPTEFKRTEYGVRIQCSSDKMLFTETKIKDPKYKYVSDSSVEYRTFCCCRNGEIVMTRSEDIASFSGRSDCEPTDQSNIGYNVRILDKKQSDDVKKHLFGNKKYSVFKDVPMQDVIGNDALTKYFGEIGNRYLVKGLKLLLKRFPDFEDSKVWGPTIEGVGDYPVTDNNMKVPDQNIWVVGDACGKFRGITACMVSGFYAGVCLARHNESSSMIDPSSS